ncbi:phospholipase D-like domain-containing protein [Arenimonas donghaensis]|uniref:PLD phosphodiesterase domain-containing protein n=1 Tax=Arenimonas donghaensis DSM 18148 = HO3-R19 TaxID=1121014 RepID=A0A087MHC5_9GAMM|nr:phospholipase D-like domain-containing protein [Arenimonas donghaensis]KFL36278.1 hypothetical protein N788_05145 [Arenimonas donghaensis DSM 18148 = HO3-R19]
MDARKRRRLKWVLLTVAATIATLAVVANFDVPDKQLERKIEHLHGVGSSQFRREVGSLLGPSVVGGNHVVAYNNGVEIFPAMLDAIRSAEHSINFETYIYWSGDVGGEFAEAFAERARAGVKVNVIIDWVGGLKMDEQLLATMQEAGVRVELYRPLEWYTLSRINNRTHRKLLVVDGEHGFTGGVGIADIWAGDAQDPEHWRDMHFGVRGPVVSQMQAAFNDNWIKTTGEVLHGELYFPPQPEAGGMDAQLFVSSPVGGGATMHLMYLMAIAAAEQSIDIHASYFVPDELAVQAMQAAIERGVKVRVLVPGEHIDSEVVRIASKKLWGPLLEAGAEVYEYNSTMMHVKMIIVDNFMVSVGSTNFDERSFQLNDEASLNVYDREFALAMTEVFERDMRQTETYDYQKWEQRPWTEKFMETVVIPLRSQL